MSTVSEPTRNQHHPLVTGLGGVYAPGYVHEGPIVDLSTFQQLQEMDSEDDDEDPFLKGLVDDYIGQAKDKIQQIKLAIEKSEPEQLAGHAHYLKGSSSALGLIRVQKVCSKLQSIGQLQNEDGTGSIKPEEAIERSKPLLEKLKSEQETAEKWLVEHVPGVKTSSSSS